jgi:hypothetical protein
LSQEAVEHYVGDFFSTDAELSYQRAVLFGRIVSSFTAEQKAYLAKMKFNDFATWPAVDVEPYKRPRGTEKMVSVAYMTFASELFSWYAGSVEADTYFCPERHGTYFGGFYMKDMPAMGKKDYDIGTSVTGDQGRAFLGALSGTTDLGGRYPGAGPRAAAGDHRPQARHPPRAAPRSRGRAAGPGQSAGAGPPVRPAGRRAILRRGHGLRPGQPEPERSAAPEPASSKPR